MRYMVLERDWKGTYERGQFKEAFLAGVTHLVGLEDEIDTGRDSRAILLSDDPIRVDSQKAYDLYRKLVVNGEEPVADWQAHAEGEFLLCSKQP